VEDLNTLYYFTQVVEHAGFAAAGRALDMPKSKLSRRISQLEERLGVRLIHRTSRHCSLTEIGQEYYQRCLAMRVEAESAAEVIERWATAPNVWWAVRSFLHVYPHRLHPLISAACQACTGAQHSVNITGNCSARMPPAR
jgi:DNA-binding transcriptional LysR family regulator